MLFDVFFAFLALLLACLLQLLTSYGKYRKTWFPSRIYCHFSIEPGGKALTQEPTHDLFPSRHITAHLQQKTSVHSQEVTIGFGPSPNSSLMPI